MARTKTSRTLTGLLVLMMAFSACASEEEPAETTAAPEQTTTVPSESPATTASVDEPEPTQPEPAARDEVEVIRLRGLRGNGFPSPFAWRRGPGWILAGMMFDTLLWEDSTGEPIPWLAESWERSDDGLEWRFTLREGAVFHDGEPVTSEDVVFSYEYMTQGAGAGQAGFAAAGLRTVESVVADGDRDVVFTLRGPSAAFEEDVPMSFFVIPEHIWSSVDAPSELRGTEATIGSGPYRLESADEATGAFLLTAFDGFHLGSPAIKRVEFVPIDDELVALQSGAIVAAETGLEQAIPEEQLAAFESQFGRVDAQGDWNRALHFNHSAGFPFDEVDFRHAIAFAIDRQDLVDRILFGRGTVGSTGGMAPGHPFHTGGLPDYAYDPTQAGALLDGLGIVDGDGDGLRDLPDGEPFAIELLASSRFLPATPELIAENLIAIGLDVSVTVNEQAVADELTSTGQYEMSLVGYGGILSDPNFLLERYSSESPDDTFTSVHGYVNPDLDALLAEQAVTVDRSAREALLAEVQQIIADDLPVLSLYVPNRTLFFDEAVFSNWYYTPGCSPCRGSRNKHMYVTGIPTGF